MTSNPLENFDDLVVWATWQMIEGITKGEPLQRSMRDVLTTAAQSMAEWKKAAAAAPIRWVQHDGHTFTKLPPEDDAALSVALRCFDEDGGWVTLCVTWSDEGTNPARPKSTPLHGRGRETRAAFAERAHRWLREHPASALWEGAA